MPRDAGASATLTPKPFLIPGYGWREWSVSELDRAAQSLVVLHAPDSERFGWRRLLGYIPWPDARQPSCLFCGGGEPWPCRPYAWAASWLSPLAQLWGRNASQRQAIPPPNRTAVGDRW